MNRLLLILFLLSGLVFAKSNLNLSIQNQQKLRSKAELLKPFNGEVTFGKPNAKVVLTIFDSYSCIHCGRFYREIFPILEKNYINKGLMFFIHKEFPLDRWALFATKIVACSKNKAEKIDEIYKNQLQFLEDKNYDKTLISSKNVNSKCVENFDDTTITKQVFEYSQVLEINGTPTVFINGEKLEKMTQKSLLQKVDAILQKQV